MFSTHILLINLSLLTGLPFLPADVLGVSVHISFTFSNTILQCLSKALTRASSFRLLRQEIRTWACDRTAVWRIDRGPEVNSCSSSCAISYSLFGGQYNFYDLWITMNLRELVARLREQFPDDVLACIHI